MDNNEKKEESLFDTRIKEPKFDVDFDDMKLSLSSSNEIKIEKINKLHNQLSGYLKHSVKIAIQIGELLSHVKNELKHGEFLPWIEKNCKFSERQGQNYMKLSTNTNSIRICNSLQDAYKQIEQIEYKEKQTEQQRKRQLINERIKTGIKPDGWDRACDYEYQKKLKEEKERDERIKRFKQKMKTEKTEKIKIETNENEKIKSNFKIINDLINKQIESNKEKIQIKNKIGMSINDDSKFIDALNDYLNTLQTDNLKLNALHNIVKYCKVKVNELQQKSIQRDRDPDSIF